MYLGKKEDFRKEDLDKIEEFKDFIEKLKKEYNLNISEALQLIFEKDILIPVSAFNKKLSILETSVKYLKEKLDFNYHKIGELIGRDERNIWHMYNSANKKHKEPLEEKESKFFIPISILRDERYSALEAVTVFMKDEFGLNYREISDLIKRDQRTVWTVYNRAKKKHAKK